MPSSDTASDAEGHFSLRRMSTSSSDQIQAGVFANSNKNGQQQEYNPPLRSSSHLPSPRSVKSTSSAAKGYNNDQLHEYPPPPSSSEQFLSGMNSPSLASPTNYPLPSPSQSRVQENRSTNGGGSVVDLRQVTNLQAVELEEIKLKTMFRMVEDVQVSVEGQTVHRKLLFLTNNQASAFSGDR
jgi:hypothetical protein